MSSAQKKKAPPPKGSMKQGSLFSFFSKKPASPSIPAANTTKKSASTTAAAAAAAASTSASTTASKSPLPSKMALSQSTTQSSSTKNVTNLSNNPDWKQLTLGTKISVYWPDDDESYEAEVHKQRGSSSTFYLKYDDGESEWIDISNEQFQIVNVNVNDNVNVNSAASVAASSNKNDASSKRRRIVDSDSEQEFEMESEEEADDDEDAYDPKSAPKEEEEEEQQDDDDQWMVTDDEDNQLVSSSNKKKSKPTSKKVKVTHHKESSPVTSSNKNIGKSVMTSSPSTSTTNANAYKTPLKQFANSVSPQTASSQKTTVSTPPTNPRRQITSSLAPPSTVSAASSSSGPPQKALDYTKGAVNPRGAHMHNHLNFLINPRDLQGRCPGEPGYNPRTLKVNSRDWEAHNGKMTDAVQQWWDLKSQYFDTFLFFKTGKFYEIFHMDADIAVDVLGLIYMKGHVAHAGFPEISYGPMADKLVRAGYKVARVEQTETPDMLAERKKKNKSRGGKTPKVVNREVCSIMTLGTRTFCFLDDENGFTQGSDKDAGGPGPLLAIREIMHDPSDHGNANVNDSEVRPVCEYGVTLIDAVRATVTIGQFADDVLRSRMNTLLTTFSPSEILLEAGENGASPTLRSLIRSLQTSSGQASRVEFIQAQESFPKSTALDPDVRRKMERKTSNVHPWDTEETLDELHRRGYYPRSSRQASDTSVTRWPKVLKAAVEGNADLLLSSFGAALFYLQLNLIDTELLSMGIVKAYVPPASSAATAVAGASGHIDQLMTEQTQEESGVTDVDTASTAPSTSTLTFGEPVHTCNPEDNIHNMSLDGTTLHNLEILSNAVDHKVAGSLWSKINYTKTPHGARLLRAWLLRPLFRKAEIDRRADAVQELVSGAGAVALSEAQQQVLGKIGDLERLLSRVHSMSGTSVPSSDDQDGSASYHPNDRAILYEGATYTKRKVGDFSKLLNGLRHACQIPELFRDVDLQSGLLRKITKLQSDGGCFPSMVDELDWFVDNFDLTKAAKGEFEPTRGCDEGYDEACDTVGKIQAELEDYREEMCSEHLSPKHTAKSSWKYVNIKPESKDKYLIELPVSVRVPDDFIVKGKRGSGHKQVNKYRTSFVAQLVQELEVALGVQKDRKARGMQLIFAKFDSMRSRWAAAAQSTALLDALGSLAKTATKPGFCRPKVLDCPPGSEPSLKIVQGRHPCVENTFNNSDFIPNDLALGTASEVDSSRVLLLSGPNMGGKSTLLRQTCLITILAQIGSFVPAEECELTPIDCIFTRLGASDRILLGQSTFFVELAETAAALRGATRRSLVIMDELGRGTSTFDGTAIAGAAVKHLVERSKCLSLFATHYHSLLDEWRSEPKVRLGHMECLVQDENGNAEAEASNGNSSITFLYTLGEGTCPKSFGINVARLASLPDEVLVNAKRVSTEFEEQMSGARKRQRTIAPEVAATHKQRIQEAIQSSNWDEVNRLWQELKTM